MHIVGFVCFGLLIGAVGRLLVAGRAPPGRGWGPSILLGLGGALLGGFFGDIGGLYRDRDPAAFVLSLITAFVFVGTYHAVATRKRLRA